jgi:hypothetical protein
MKDFIKGVVAGALSVLFIFGVIFTLVYFYRRERAYKKELIEYAEKQIEIEEMREAVINRDPDEFLEIPGVRRAADGAAAEFERKRDEAIRAIQRR